MDESEMQSDIVILITLVETSEKIETSKKELQYSQQNMVLFLL
jgi:hypothetical protein